MFLDYLPQNKALTFSGVNDAPKTCNEKGTTSRVDRSILQRLVIALKAGRPESWAVFF